MLQRRKVPEKASLLGPSAIQTSKLLMDLENLIKHCTEQSYTDGERRTPGWFTLSASRGIWKVVVKDPDSASQLVAEDEDLDVCLAIANRLLGDAETAWTPDPWLAKGKPRSRRIGR